MSLEGQSIPEAEPMSLRLGGPSNHGSGFNLGCDRTGHKGHCQDWSELIGMASGSLGEENGVGQKRMQSGGLSSRNRL